MEDGTPMDILSGIVSTNVGRDVIGVLSSASLEFVLLVMTISTHMAISLPRIFLFTVVMKDTTVPTNHIGFKQKSVG